MPNISTDPARAAALLRAGRLVAIPTETVYGLAANIFDEAAVRSIFRVKQRPLFNPLIVHLSAADRVETVARRVPPTAQRLAAAFWPGPLTLVLKKQPTVPDLITAGKNTVAVRVPDHPRTLELLAQLPFPLAAPSANPFNRISPTRAAHVADYFGDEIPLILDGGECPRGIESTILGFEDETPVLYRLGSLALEDIEAVAGPVLVRNQAAQTPDAPGMLKKHYAPRTETRLLDGLAELPPTYAPERTGVICFTDAPSTTSFAAVRILSERGDYREAAARLYDTLHELDRLGLDLIVALRFPDRDLGRTINDRLERAAS